jgi:hypothetical protein
VVAVADNKNKILADYTVRVTHTSSGLGFTLHGVQDNERSIIAVADAMEAIAEYLRGRLITPE